jgi:hypothetical protein
LRDNGRVENRGKARLSDPFRKAMTEDELQVSVVQLLNLYEARGLLRAYHIPNQLPRPKMLVNLIGIKSVNMIYAMIENKLQKMGKRKGFPDIAMVFNDGRSAYWELKVGKNKPTKEQAEWLNWLDLAGCKTAVIRDLADAEILLQDYVRRAA